MTARDRCSLAISKEVMSGIHQASAVSAIRFVTGSPRGDENDGE